MYPCFQDHDSAKLGECGIDQVLGEDGAKRPPPALRPYSPINQIVYIYIQRTPPSKRPRRKNFFLSYVKKQTYKIV
jgi:hypothetical protein